ncbi:carboxypeptidase regulatory-like domain-containing protein [Streptomyces sp. NBC_01361]|uniref:carboxypeptidase regulatory-like domain-containing protein n=1 Tax=Streptomyces sp. NBC_01361 TaxID=2903838 RepID=UPI002E347EC1|nr:carboxypeptidase regulatory-like domain-containing protein [Streptomyces sp. NBC_01361]
MDAGTERDTVESSKRSLGRPAKALAEAAWFPAVLFLGIIFVFAPALHAPGPHHVKVVVAGGEAAAARIDADLDARYPGGFDVHNVADPKQARQAVLDRGAFAGYAPDEAHPVLYVAKANGASLEQTLTTAFGEVAGSADRLAIRDVAPTAGKDLLGSTVLYFATAWNIPAYILATMLLRAVAFDRRRKLMAIAVVAAVFSGVGYAVGTALGYLNAEPAVMGVAFLLTTAVATAASGLAPFTRQFLPAIGMTLFIVISIPTSGGAVPAPLMPGFFQGLHAVMPLANAVDALRGVVYFGGAGVLKPVLVLCAWIAAGAGLLGLDFLRHRRAAVREAVAEPPVDDPALETPVPTALPVHRHHFGEPVPVLTGAVRDLDQEPVRGAAVIVLDGRGRQLVSTVTDQQGRYAVTALPEGHLVVVASAPGMHPLAHRKLLRAGEMVTANFTLARREASVETAVSGGPTTVPR